MEGFGDGGVYGFRGLGFFFRVRCRGLGFRAEAPTSQKKGFRISGLGFRACEGLGLGFRVYRVIWDLGLRA